jgi:hypothetical protein
MEKGVKGLRGREVEGKERASKGIGKLKVKRGESIERTIAGF